MTVHVDEDSVIRLAATELGMKPGEVSRVIESWMAHYGRAYMRAQRMNRQEKMANAVTRGTTRAKAASKKAAPKQPKDGTAPPPSEAPRVTADEAEMAGNPT